MNAAELSIQYPLYALLGEPERAVSCDLADARPRGTGIGIPIFTTEEKATEFLTSAGFEAQVLRLERESVFRTFLHRLRTKNSTILFDPRLDRRGNLRITRQYPRTYLLESVLRSGFVWEYPLYFLRLLRGRACFCGSHDIIDLGRMELLHVFTDWDLADRAILLKSNTCTAAAINNELEFARLVSGLPAEVNGVIFDPPLLPAPGGGPTRIAMLLRDELLAALEAEF